MKASRIMAALAATVLSAGGAISGEVTDAAGRTVTIPDRVEHVFAAGPPAAIILYTLAPDKMLGWTRAPSPGESAYLPERYRDLPTHGRLTGRGDVINLERLLALDPDLAVDIGSVGPTYATLADRVVEQTGVPAILLGGRLDELADTYRLLGDILGAEQQADRLAGYVEDTLNDVHERIGALPGEARPRVYYARGPEGLDTALSGSINAEALDFVQVRNVAGESSTGRGLTAVSMEQVIAWNPDVIVTIDPAFAATVDANPVWQTIEAVRNGRIHLAPQYPFPWIDYPPSANRVIGVRWLAAVLYPEIFPEPLDAITREFYDLFYHKELSDEELSSLLKP